MLNDEQIHKQLGDIEQEVERQKTHLKDARDFFDNMTQALVDFHNRLEKLEKLITGPSDSRRNCLSCGRIITTVNHKCGFCGTIGSP